MKATIEEKIYLIRGQRVMLDRDLAELYKVSTGRLNEQVRRNIPRFPPDFMFQLNVVEADSLRSHFAISRGRGGRRYRPLVFTEQGVAMLSSVLHSEQAAIVNVAIMRAFVKLRHAMTLHRDVAVKVEHIAGRVNLLETDIRLLREDLRDKKESRGKPPAKIKGFEKE